MPISISRRDFMVGAGASFATGFGLTSGNAQGDGGQLFASAYRKSQRDFGVLLFDERGEAISHFALPGRGHDIALSPTKELGVAFARRPGNFALVFHIADERESITISASTGRHFYGHGVFSADGKLLYATENDFENAAGVIGIYDATNQFERIGEFSSFGTGPHEILISHDDRWLIVANGGIETHPEFGRAKLNLPTMKPSITFIERASGVLLESHSLPQSFHHLSIRHLDIDQSGTVFFGCQYQGSKADFPPLAGSTSLGGEMEFFDVPAEKWQSFANYVGSVALHSAHHTLAVTMPKANRIAYFDTLTGKLKQERSLPRAFGIVAGASGFIVNSEKGVLETDQTQSVYPNLEFDNHIAG